MSQELVIKAKVCGLTRFEDAKLASDLGAWALGFIFYKKSPRFISASAVEKIIDGLSDETKKVGVFVNAPIHEVAEIVSESHIDTVQLHGDETAQDVGLLRQALPQVKIIKVVRPQNQSDLVGLKEYKNCEAFLLDTYSEKLAGGTGKTSRWDSAQEIKRHGPLILSGGLDIHNVREAIEMVAPYAIDLSSGLEEKPGVKSHKKIRDFFHHLRPMK